MPIIKSAIKRMHQNRRRQARRQPDKTYMKTMIRKFTDLVKAKKAKEAEQLLPQVFKAIDMAAKKHIIHSRNAARKKSRMSRLIAGLKG